MPSQVFMPLRSNAGWFESPDTRKALERQIKVNLMIYDRVIFQNGRWHMTAGYDSQGMEMPPTFYKFSDEQRRHISYGAKGSHFGIQMGDVPILQSTAEISLNADFYPILYDAGLLETTCYRWQEKDSAITKLPGADRAISDIVEACADVLPNNRFARRCLVEGFIKDSLLAQAMKVPMTVDYQVSPFVLKHHHFLLDKFEPDMRRRFFDRWVSVDLPDFSDFTWDEIIDARESQAGIAFREMVARVCATVTKAVADGADESDIDHLVLVGITKELIAELTNGERRLVRRRLAWCLTFLHWAVWLILRAKL
jgi:hypothetical protein